MFEFVCICSFVSEVIMEVYNFGFEVCGKDDKFFVMDVDEWVEKIIFVELKKNFVDILVFVEESFFVGICL